MSGRNRAVRVVTVTQDGIRTNVPNDEWIDATLERLDWAASGGPDIACLPEGWPRQPTPVDLEDPLYARLSAWALGEAQ